VVDALKARKVPALVDTGAQFSCARADVAEFLYLKVSPVFFLFVVLFWPMVLVVR
jgi:hypothetical protein